MIYQYLQFSIKYFGLSFVIRTVRSSFLFKPTNTEVSFYFRSAASVPFIVKYNVIFVICFYQFSFPCCDIFDLKQFNTKI